MTFEAVLEHAQKKGCALLQKRIEERRNQGVKVYPEAALRDNAGEVVTAPDGLKLPLRCDLVFQQPSGEFVRDEAESSTLNFRDPVFAHWENRMRIEIRSLSWDYLRMELPAGTYDWEGVRRWFLRWFDAEDKKEPGPDGLSGIVHFMSDPESTGPRTILLIDFGSAPIAALGEIFDELVKLGIASCLIGTQADSEQFMV